MTIKEFIKREKESNTGLTNLIQRHLENIQIDKTMPAHKSLYIYEKHMLEGIFATLIVLNLIDTNEYYELLDDIENY